MKRTNIGGQAVLEGVMMRGKRMYAIAIRKPNQDIVIDKKPIKSFADRCSLFKWPIFRGMLAFVESMVVGIQILSYSAEFIEDGEEEEKPSKIDEFLQKKLGDKLNDYIIGFSLFLAIIFGIGLFMVVPLWISRLFKTYIDQFWMRNILEGIIRISIFVGYIALISRMKDIQRVFQYHGAEHKTINCYEHGQALTVDNVRKYTRLHKRCGTSFLLIVMVISILVFMMVEVDIVWMRFMSRIVLVPIIAGLSYEVIKWAGRSESKLVDIISLPGMCLQKMTTAEPDDTQIEVAIAAMKGVLEDEPDSDC